MVFWKEKNSRLTFVREAKLQPHKQTNGLVSKETVVTRRWRNLTSYELGVKFRALDLRQSDDM